MSTAIASLIILYLLAINASAYAAFYWDKRQAVRGAWRVPEDKLLTLALLGGSPLAKLAQRAFRHKTRKQPFAMILNLILAFHLALAGAVAAITLWPAGSGGMRGLIEYQARQTPVEERRMPRRFGPGSED